MTQNTFQSMKLENNHHGACFESLLPFKKQSRFWVFLVQNRIKVGASQANPTAAEKCVHSQSSTPTTQSSLSVRIETPKYCILSASQAPSVCLGISEDSLTAETETASHVFQVKREDSYICRRWSSYSVRISCWTLQRSVWLWGFVLPLQ